MIDYKDLMIGNWVYLSEKSKFPMKVVGIGEDYCYLDFDENEGDPFDGIDKEMMPIEVTEDLLVKIGFEKIHISSSCDDLHYSNYINGFNTVVSFLNNKEKCVFENLDNELCSFYFKYLHELQNGIRLITKADWDINM